MPIYGFIIITKEIMDWTAKSGQKIRLEIELLDEVIDDFSNGKWRSKNLNITETVYIDGVESGCTVTKFNHNFKMPEIVTCPGEIVAIIGRVGLDANQYNLYLTLRQKVEQHPRWMKRNES